MMDRQFLPDFFIQGILEYVTVTGAFAILMYVCKTKSKFIALLTNLHFHVHQRYMRKDAGGGGGGYWQIYSANSWKI